MKSKIYTKGLIFSIIFLLNTFVFAQYTCQPVDFTFSQAGPYTCTSPVVNLLANDPPSTLVADQWIYPGFIIKVWPMPSYTWSTQTVDFLDNGTAVLTENAPVLPTDTLVLAIDHVQPGSYGFRINNIGSRQFGFTVINAADASIAQSGTFITGSTTTNTFSPLGTWGYTGPGVSNDPNNGGNGLFDPSIAGAGTHTITYSWNNGAGCSGTKSYDVVVTCNTPPSPTYTCQTVDFTFSQAGPYNCTDPVVDLFANDPPNFDQADQWIYPGFILSVWPMPTYSWTTQSIDLYYNTAFALNQTKPAGANDTLILSINHAQPGNYYFKINNIGGRHFGYNLVNAADGTIAESGTFISGSTTTGTYGPVGTANFTGPGVSNDPNNGGNGFFDPSVAGAGTHTITYSWDNGAGCSGTKSYNVVVNCNTPPSCSAAIGTFSTTKNGASASGTVYNLLPNETFSITANGDAVLPPKSGTDPAGVGYAAFTCDPATMDLTQLSTFTVTNSCFKGFQFNGTFNDVNDNSSNSSGNALGVTTYWLVPITFDDICSPLKPSSNCSPAGDNNIGVDLNADNCFATGAPIQINYVTQPTCPSDLTFINLDWTQNNPFGNYTATTLTCNDSPTTIWKNIESSTIDQGGELQAVPGFIMSLVTNNNSDTKTSVLVSVNGTPYSYYGPTGTAPANVLDWGPMAVPPSSQLILEPFIAKGATITLQICDTRNAAQSFAYDVWDYATGQKMLTGTATPSNGNCTTLTFTLSSPTITWDIDGSSSAITNNNDGSATFDPTKLSAGSHTINYYFTNGTCPSLHATQAITVTAPKPTFNAISALCQNATPPTLQTTSNNGIIGTWSPATISTATVGTQKYYFTPNQGQCGKNDSISVTINSTTTPTFNSIASICQGAVAPALPGSSTNSINGTWSPATISTNTAGTQQYTFTPTAGQCANSTTVNVTINPKVTPTFNAISNICQGAVAPLLPASSTNSINGTWSPATISTATAGTQQYAFTPTAGQCANSSNINITIDAKVTPQFDALTDVCKNSTPITLPTSSKDNPAITGTWSPAVSTNLVGSLTYTFTPTIGQCANQTTLSQLTLAQPIADAVPSVISGAPTLEVTFTNISVNSTSSVWDFGNGLNSNSNSNTVSTSYSQPGIYEVKLTASNGVCPDAIWKQTIVVKYPEMTFEIPNVFTPNGDNTNDDFFIKGTNIDTFEGLIINRWGEEMYKLEKISDKWNGITKSGDKAPTGVYYLQYTIKGLDGTEKTGNTFFHLY